jgi:exopolysaccharide biosynthesis polyprenyl glycosylphosphotransferase
MLSKPLPTSPSIAPANVVPRVLTRAPSVPSAAASPSAYWVPGRFVWLADALVQVVAFLLAWQLAPLLQRALWEFVTGPAPSLTWLSITPASQALVLRPFTEVVWILLVMIPVTLLFLHVLGGHNSLLEQTRTRICASSVIAPLVGASIVSLMLIMVRDRNVSRSLVLGFALLSAAGFLSHRFGVRAYKLRRLNAGVYARSVVIAASAPARRLLARHFERQVSPNFCRLTGYLRTPNEQGARPVGDEPNLECLGFVDELGQILVNTPIDEIVAVQSTGSERWLRDLAYECEYFRVVLRLVPEVLLDWDAPDLQRLFRGDGLRLPHIVLRPRYLDSEALFAKRVFDILVSGVLLVLLSPLFLLIAAAIKLTTPSLPVFYPWRVVGYKGRTFTGYKFTTMVADADERKAELQHLNEMDGPVFKIKDDPRITPLGKVLRKFSLNELPQIWSVLKGDMSLVGPRPAYPHELARYELWHKRKLCVQPGITCLWQIRGRNKISNFDDWVRMDFEYIDQWSLWLDFVILVRTMRAVITGTGS